MDPQAKKTALRMIPYGIYVLGASDGNGAVAAATVNWVTQTSFAPPMVAVALRADSAVCAVTKAAGAFAVNCLGKHHRDLAFTFFRPSETSDGTLNGHAYRSGRSGAPLLDEAIAAMECRVVAVVEEGDHHVFVGEVIDAHLATTHEGRPDAATLEMKDLGETVFYGG